MQSRIFNASLNKISETAQLPQVTERKPAFNKLSDNYFESAYSIFSPIKNISQHNNSLLKKHTCLKGIITGCNNDIFLTHLNPI